MVIRRGLWIDVFDLESELVSARLDGEYGQSWLWLHFGQFHGEDDEDEERLLQ